MNETTGGIEIDENASGAIKKFMFVNRKAPYGTIYARSVLVYFNAPSCFIHLLVAPHRSEEHTSELQSL